MSPVSFSTRQQRFACVRLPDPHLTPHAAPFPHRSPRSRRRSRSMWRFEASPRRATPKGRQSFISCTAPLHEALPTSNSLPRSGHTQTMTHDYKPHTPHLFAALNIVRHDHRAVPSRHRHQEWLKLLKTIDRQVPKDLQIPPDPRQQSRHPPTRRRPRVARHRHPFPPPLHSDIVVVAQPGRTWFRD